jgi:superfamily II DNA or RNA helicase
MEPPTAPLSTSGLRAGDVVIVRSSRWHVVAVRPGHGCEAVSLRAEEGGGREAERTLLHPFDRFAPVVPSGLPARATRRRCRRAWLAARAGVRGLDVPLSAARAAIDLLPYQLEPALAILGGLASRVLLADRVGLGKTIQAGIVIRELLDRAMLRRALILCPAGLREQWRAELASRFGVHAVACDAAWLADRARSLAEGRNPWTGTGVLVASTEFVKQPEVLQGVKALPWDLVLVDEAHAAARDSDRARAVHEIAASARVVLMLTATPHDGDTARFGRLAGIGRLHPSADPLALFRRGPARRAPRETTRWVRLRVALAREERHMHVLLAAYTRRLVEAQVDGSPARLIASVLGKRAYSTAGALLATLARRHALLACEPLATPVPLPFDAASDADLPADTDLDDRLLGAPALADPRHERAWLGALVSAARAAARHESKLSAIDRLLRATAEPMVVFTEFRDSLALVWSRFRARCPTGVLHGGLGTEERQAVLDEFAAGRVRLLAATDVASEGLNLQYAARLVVNLELPWSPVRLEQRAGRVDRIGQARRVHVVCLVARGTGEERLEEVIARRAEIIRAELDAPCGSADPPAPLVDVTEAGDLPADDEAADPAACLRPDLGAAARLAADRLRDARRCAAALCRDHGRVAASQPDAFDLVDQARLTHEAGGRPLQLGAASTSRTTASGIAAWIRLVTGPRGERLDERLVVAAAALHPPGASSPPCVDLTGNARQLPALLARDQARRAWIAARLRGRALAPRQLPLFSTPYGAQTTLRHEPEEEPAEEPGADGQVSVGWRPLLSAPGRRGPA